MANFPIIGTNYQGRTNLNLVVSEGNAPAEPFIASAAESVKFQHVFGPDGNNNVVIPRGKIVSAAGLEYDVQQEKNRPTLKIATEGEYSLGVSMDNAYEARLDRTSVNEVTLITRNYIRVPLFGSKEYAKAINYGAAWTADENLGTLMGKYVVSDENGNFRAYVKDTDAPECIVGQCLAVETDLPPAGFLQYFIEAMGADNEFTKLIAGTATNFPSPGRVKGKTDMDIDTFPMGSYIKDKASLAYILRNFRAGIPFLTDGYFKARTEKTFVLVADTNATTRATKLAALKVALIAEKAAEIDLDDNIAPEDKAAAKTAANLVINKYAALAGIRVMGNTTVTDGFATVDGHVGSAIFLTIPKDNKLCLTKLASDDAVINHPEMNGNVDKLIVKVGDETIPAGRLHFDYENNIVGIYFAGSVTAKSITIEATVLENQVPGIPTGWDFANNMGEARILLMK